MADLEQFVQGVQSRLSKIDVDAFFAALKIAEKHHHPFDFALVLAHGIFHYDELHKELAAALGSEQVAAVFDTTLGIGEVPLLSLFLNLTEVLPDATVRVDEHALLDSLNQVADSVKRGELEYTISLHLTNIDIDEEFEIAPGIRFIRRSPFDVQDEYSPEGLFGVSDFVRAHWLQHCVDAVIDARGKMSDIHKFFDIDYVERLLHSIVHPFILAEITSVPHVTHVRFESLVSNNITLFGIGRFSANPKKLTNDDIARLQRTYALLQDASNDRVLETAIERFLLGHSRSERHPYHLNEPNWDKLVDYVIAMETLFLGGVEAELKYRFALNGSSVLSACTEHNRLAILKALKKLYDLRSKIVHGSLSNIESPATRFLDELCLAVGTRGPFEVIVKTVEAWLIAVLLHYSALPVEERPYRKVDGWEDLLFGSTTSESD